MANTKENVMESCVCKEWERRVHLAYISVLIVLYIWMRCNELADCLSQHWNKCTEKKQHLDEFKSVWHWLWPVFAFIGCHIRTTSTAMVNFFYWKKQMKRKELQIGKGRNQTENKRKIPKTIRWLLEFQNNRNINGVVHWYRAPNNSNQKMFSVACLVTG